MTKHQQILAEFRSSSTLTKKIYDRTMEPLCSQYHISRMELDIMLFLANNPDYDTARDIVEQKRFTKSHVSTSLHLLEKKGYLERALHPGNLKTIHLKLLPASSQIVTSGQNAQRQIFSQIFGSLSQEEISVLERISQKINTAIRDTLKEE